MRSWQAIALAIIAGVGGLATGNHVAIIAALALGGIVLIGGIYRIFSVGDVRGDRTVGDDVIPWGESFAQQIHLSNDSWIGIPAIRVTDLTTLPEHPGGYVASLGARKSITWDVVVPCRQRGRYQIGPVEASMSDPLGLFPVSRRLGPAGSVLVLPRWVPLQRTGLKLDGFLPGEIRGRRRGEAPPTVTSVREYANGDSVSSIHWQASARMNQLMTKLFDPEVQTTLWLALDLDGMLSPAVEELLVTATTSLGMYALHRANLRVGLVASGRSPLSIPAERGKPHQYRLQEVLAEVHPGGATKLTDLLARLDRRFGPGQAVALVTSRDPEVWGGWLGLLARQGVAARVIQVTTEETIASGWSVPSIALPVTLGDDSQESALIQHLEGRVRDVAGVLSN